MAIGRLTTDAAAREPEFKEVQGQGASCPRCPTRSGGDLFNSRLRPLGFAGGAGRSGWYFE